MAQLNQQQAAEMEDIITSPPEQEPYDQLKAELVRRLFNSREQRVRQLCSHEDMVDWKALQFFRHLTGSVPDVPDDFLRTIWASRILPHVQPYSPGILWAVLTQPPTSRTEFARSYHCPLQRASHPRRPTALLCYQNVSRNSRARLLHCGHHAPTTARSPMAATVRTPEITAPATRTTLGHPTTPAGTTDISGTPPENAHQRAPASNATTASRKTPPAAVNGG